MRLGSIYGRAIEELAGKVEAKTGLSFAERPSIEVGGLDVLIPYAERILSQKNFFAGNPKSKVELKVDVHNMAQQMHQHTLSAFDPTINSVIINLDVKKGYADNGGLAYLLVGALQHQEAGENTVLLYDLGLGKWDERAIQNIAISGQRIYLAHEIMSESRDETKEDYDGFRRISKAISLSPLELASRALFVRELKQASSAMGIDCEVGYSNVLRTEVDSDKLLGQLEELSRAFLCSEPDLLRDCMKVVGTFNHLRQIGLGRRLGYQVHRDLANAGVSAKQIMTQIPSTFSGFDPTYGFYSEPAVQDYQ
jgi:hypothetical protein